MVDSFDTKGLDSLIKALKKDAPKKLSIIKKVSTPASKDLGELDLKDVVKASSVMPWLKQVAKVTDGK